MCRKGGKNVHSKNKKVEVGIIELAAIPNGITGSNIYSYLRV